MSTKKKSKSKTAKTAAPETTGTPAPVPETPQTPAPPETATPPKAPETVADVAATPETGPETATAVVPPVQERPWRWGYVLWVLLALGAWLGLAALNAWWGELNQDEGWYLNAARMMAAGKIPYRDFAFTQPPMLPLVYGSMWSWMAPSGVLGGRVFTALLGLAAALLAARLAMRLAPHNARRLSGGLAFTLCAVNFQQAYFTTIVKTYSLASLFLVSGLLLLTHVGKWRGARAAFGAGFLLTCAAATRLSLGAAFVPALPWLFFSGKKVRSWAWLDFMIGAGVAFTLLVLPFALMAPDNFVFGVTEYHTLREAGPALSTLLLKGGCVARLAQAYLPAFLLGTVLVALRLWGRKLLVAKHVQDPVATEKRAREDLPPHATLLLWLILAVMALVHLSAPFPYDDYQTPLYPLFAALLANAATRAVVRRESASALVAPLPPGVRTARRNGVLLTVFVLCALHAFSSPMLQNAFVAGRDTVWWLPRDKSPITQLRDEAKILRTYTLAAQGTALFTQDTYLAVEADLDVPHGLELGPFSYFPGFSDDEAAKRHVMNRNLMAGALSNLTNAPVVALSGYGLTIASPQVERVAPADAELFESILSNRYDLAETVPSFGQASTPLRIFRVQTAGLPPKDAAPVIARQKKHDPLAPPRFPPAESIEPVVDDGTAPDPAPDGVAPASPAGDAETEPASLVPADDDPTEFAPPATRRPRGKSKTATSSPAPKTKGKAKGKAATP